MYFAHQIRKGLSFRVIVLLLIIPWAPVKKYILFSGVTVQINEHSNPFISIFLFYQLFQEMYFWVIVLARLFPLTIEIYPCGRESIVASTNTVDIDHWNNLDQETLSEKSGMFRVWNDFFDEALGNKRRNSFSWMHSAWNYYHFFTIRVSHTDQRDASTIEAAS